MVGARGGEEIAVSQDRERGCDKKKRGRQVTPDDLCAVEHRWVGAHYGGPCHRCGPFGWCHCSTKCLNSRGWHRDIEGNIGSGSGRTEGGSSRDIARAVGMGRRG